MLYLAKKILSTQRCSQKETTKEVRFRNVKKIPRIFDSVDFRNETTFHDDDTTRPCVSSVLRSLFLSFTRHVLEVSSHNNHKQLAMFQERGRYIKMTKEQEELHQRRRRRSKSASRRKRKGVRPSRHQIQDAKDEPATKAARGKRSPSRRRRRRHRPSRSSNLDMTDRFLEAMLCCADSTLDTIERKLDIEEEMQVINEDVQWFISLW